MYRSSSSFRANKSQAKGKPHKKRIETVTAETYVLLEKADGGGKEVSWDFGDDESDRIADDLAS